MTRIIFILGFMLFARPVVGYVDLPVPQTSAVVEYSLPAPYKQATVSAIADYDPKEDIIILKSLNIKIDSIETAIPVAVLNLFEGPRLDTLRLFVCPEIMMEPNEFSPKDRMFFAITFRFGARASLGSALEDRPTAWIAIKNGKIVNIMEIQDIRRSTVPTKEYHLDTLKPIDATHH